MQNDTNDTNEIDEDDEIEESECEHLLFRETQIDPAEYCDEIAEPGTDRCRRHTGRDW